MVKQGFRTSFKRIFLAAICFGIFLLTFSFFLPHKAFADLTIHVGPPAVGGGGPNPVSIPPVSLLDYEVVWLRKDHSEWSFSVFPGLFYGIRSTTKSGAYLSVGAGLVLGVQGLGPGVYSAFGYEACGWTCFNIEYKQALGIIPGMLIQPYALRVGVTLFKH